MADEADGASPNIENVVADGVKEAQRKVAEIPPGNPGECAWCGDHSWRLVHGACAPCRDKYGI